MSMRKLIVGLLLGAALATGTGCAVPMYSADPQRRTRQLLNTSENLRLLLDDWERIWMLDQPSHLTPWVTHGGII
jgi:hypothetical protein